VGEREGKLMKAVAIVKGFNPKALVQAEIERVIVLGIGNPVLDDAQFKHELRKPPAVGGAGAATGVNSRPGGIANNTTNELQDTGNDRRD